MVCVLFVCTCSVYMCGVLCVSFVLCVGVVSLCRWFECVLCVCRVCVLVCVLCVCVCIVLWYVCGVCIVCVSVVCMELCAWGLCV